MDPCIARMLSPLVLQATLVFDNARSHPVTATQTSYTDIPALCHFNYMSASRKCQRSRSLSLRKVKKRSESFPAPEKNRWESMSLISANRIALSATSLTSPVKLTLLSRRHASSDDLNMHALLIDSPPRRPRRTPSVSAISILDEALNSCDCLELDECGGQS